ncbi:MAG: carbohydrate kinase family protein [Planctomycetes bacterium]|jgi:sugar/nucleoside kinase (ribokinase family)|nr:carbohydrate kinase family protein [Planctomycetota bacterium]
MKYDFVSIGGCTQDVYIYADGGEMFKNLADGHEYYGFKFGGKSLVSSVHFFFGGGAANTSVSFANLGFKALPITAIGSGLRGADILKNLEDKKVDTSLVQKYKHEKSGYSVIVLGPGNEHILFTYRGANGLVKIGRKEEQAIKSADWVYISSLSGDWKKLLKKIFAIRQHNIAWNPGGAQLKAGKKELAEYIKKTTVLILNSDEALDLVHPEYTAQLDKEKMMEIIYGWGPDYFLMTEGAEGAHLYDGQKFYFQKALRKKHITDTTGAGDAFGSGFVAGLKLFKHNLPKALRVAAMNSAHEIALLGPQRDLLKKWEVPRKKKK